MVNMAFIESYRRVGEEGYDARPILQIHDEIAFEVNDDHVKQVTEIIREEMTRGVPGLTVPLEVEISIKKCWGES